MYAIRSYYVAFYFVLGGLILAVMTKCRIRIKKAEGDDVNIGKVINNVTIV